MAARTLSATSEVRFNRFLALVYLVMAIGMAVTAWVATSVSNNEELMKRILFDPWFTDSVILGTSILENTSSHEASRILGGRFVNLSLSAGDFFERGLILRHLLEPTRAPGNLFPGFHLFESAQGVLVLPTGHLRFSI